MKGYYRARVKAQLDEKNILANSNRDIMTARVANLEEELNNVHREKMGFEQMLVGKDEIILRLHDNIGNFKERIGRIQGESEQLESQILYLKDVIKQFQYGME